MKIRRLRRGAELTLRSPASAWVLLRMLAWKHALSVLKGVVSFQMLVRLTQPRRAGPQQDLRELQRIEFLVARLGGNDDCVERSLVAYRFLARAGARPKLFLGFDRSPQRRGHAWVEVGDRPLVESRAALEPFVPVAQFPKPA